MIVKIIEMADYDIAKYYDPEISEDPEEAESDSMVKVMKSYFS